MTLILTRMDSKIIPQTLIQKAIAALEYSHPSNPKNLRFGSAVQTASNQFYSASAFWSDTLTLAVHAEHAALVHAAANNSRDIVAVACVSTEDEEGEQFCHPCGICKQLIYESSIYSGIDVQVFMANLKGKFIMKSISELVPFPWPNTQ